MKKWLVLIVSLALGAGLFPLAFQFVTLQEAAFTDPAFEKAVHEQIGADSSLTKAQLEDVLSLDLRSADVESLEDLRYFPALQELDASHNQIADLGPLEHTPSLHTLILEDNEIEDVRALTELEWLETVDLSHNQIKNIEGAGKATDIVWLNLSNNQLDDVQALQELVFLEELFLPNNNLTNIDILGDLPYLHSLDARNNNIGDLTALEDAFSLNRLFYIAGNPAADTGDLLPFYNRVRTIDFSVEEPEAGSPAGTAD